jgi:hypothetical protein
MDEHLTFKNEGKLSLEEAATVGVGALVSFFRDEEGENELLME